MREFTLQQLINVASTLHSTCPKANISFTSNNLQVKFDSTNPENPDIKGFIYKWDFGDGTTRETKNKLISYDYNIPGIYSVKLEIVTHWGGTATSSVNVEVTTPPIQVIYPVKMSYSTQNLRLFFNGSGGPIGAIYRWNFGDNVIESTSELTITHDYALNGIYFVTLEVLDNSSNVVGSGALNILALEPEIKILSSPASIIAPGSTINYKVQCDVGEMVEMDSNITYDFLADGFNAIGITDFISDCTGLGEQGYGESTGTSIHDINCRVRTFTETNFYSYIVANNLNISEEPVDVCNYISNIRFYASFSCTIIDPVNNEKYKSSRITANPIDIHYSAPATCPAK